MADRARADGQGAAINSDVLTFGDGLPLTRDPVQARLREQLRSKDLDVRTNAALRLGASYLRSQPKLGERLLLQAFEGPPQTAARAMLRLAFAKFESKDEDDPAAVTRLLYQARHRTSSHWLTNGEIDDDLLRARIDIASTLAIAGRPMEAIGILLAADLALRNAVQPLPGRDERARELRRLQALVNLRLGQTQMATDFASAAAAFRMAAKYGSSSGSSSVMANAALELGRLLEKHGGNGPDIEEQYRRAAEAGDICASPPAMLALGDLLYRHNRQDLAPEWWKRARDIGNGQIAARVQRRISGEWQAKERQRRAKPRVTRLHTAMSTAPLTDAVPPTPLGRMASGRTPTELHAGEGKPKAIVVGAGTGGHYLLPGLRQQYEVIGFVDDNVDRLDSVFDVPVRGPIGALRELLLEHTDIVVVVFAIPTADGVTRRRALEATLACQRRMLTLPSMFELWRGQPLVPQLRPMELHEIFGAFPWHVDRAAAAVACGRRVAIFGAGTWIGQALARRVVHGQARHLLLVDEDPVRLRLIDDELHMIPDAIETDARVVDSAERAAAEEVFRQFRPDLVFHCESLNYLRPDVLPLQHAARANVQSADVIACLAREYGARDFVLASADRAGHRTCSFDMTKALAEAAVLEHCGASGTTHADELPAGYERGLRVSILRLPNVWCKDGPIVGRLTRQLSRGGPLRLDQRAARKFIPTWEAAQALLRIVGGDHRGGIFAYTGGETVALREIAHRLIWMNGLANAHVIIEDDPQPETKLNLDTIGPDEKGGYPYAPHTLRVGQPETVKNELRERACDVRAALADGRGVAHLLKPTTLPMPAPPAWQAAR
jgi:FlaA1/EpsC-like NDP-sugar epimerase